MVQRGEGIYHRISRSLHAGVVLHHLNLGKEYKKAYGLLAS